MARSRGRREPRPEDYKNLEGLFAWSKPVFVTLILVVSVAGAYFGNMAMKGWKNEIHRQQVQSGAIAGSAPVAASTSSHVPVSSDSLDALAARVAADTEHAAEMHRRAGLPIEERPSRAALGLANVEPDENLTAPIADPAHPRAIGEDAPPAAYSPRLPGAAPVAEPCGQLEVSCPTGFSCTEKGTCENDAMVYVPPGKFLMGCNIANHLPCDNDERPFHTVKLSAYAIDRTEVTVGAYRACVAAGGCFEPAKAEKSRACNYAGGGDPQQPVNCVTWEQARRYCFWKLERLPTEAEWEKAARGTHGQAYPWGDEEASCQHANISMGKDCVGSSRKVGSYPKGISPYGALDMIGNVLEWTNDAYSAQYYYDSPAENPEGPLTTNLRALRGSGFGEVIKLGHHASARYNLTPDSSSILIGFRCARSID